MNYVIMHIGSDKVDLGTLSETFYLLLTLAIVYAVLIVHFTHLIIKWELHAELVRKPKVP